MHGAVVGQGDGVRAWVEGRYTGLEAQVNVVLAVPRRVIDGEFGQSLPPKPFSRNASAPFAPARPPPTMTNVDNSVLGRLFHDRRLGRA